MRLKKTTETFKEEVKALVGDEYTVLGGYTNCHIPILIKHNTCGNKYYVSPTNFLTKNQRCPKCSYDDNKSNSEKEISKFIKSFYNKSILESDRTILNGQELDIYLPENKIAFEFDGLYWHSDKFRDKDYHLNKTIECQKKGIRLIHIFEDEWINKNNIIKSKIKHILGYNDNPKIYARKCYIELIESHTKTSFLNDNHIQGDDNSSIRLGLWFPQDDGDVLISVMTFCKPRLSLGQKSNSIYDYELSRFACDKDYRVIGAFGKLFAYFKKNYEFGSIITYADRRWSEGNVYATSNFILDHYSKPNYWYIPNNTNFREHRFKYRKQNLKKLFPELYDDTKTEFQIMKEAKYSKIYDCGNMVFIHTNKKE